MYIKLTKLYILVEKLNIIIIINIAGRSSCNRVREQPEVLLQLSRDAPVLQWGRFLMMMKVGGCGGGGHDPHEQDVYIQRVNVLVIGKLESY